MNMKYVEYIITARYDNGAVVKDTLFLSKEDLKVSDIPKSILEDTFDMDRNPKIIDFFQSDILVA